MNCPKCKLEDVEGEEIRPYLLSFECPDCNHKWDDSETIISNLMERGKNKRKYGELS